LCRQQATAKAGTSDEAINSGRRHGLTWLDGYIRSMPILADDVVSVALIIA